MRISSHHTNARIEHDHTTSPPTRLLGDYIDISSDAAPSRRGAGHPLRRGCNVTHPQPSAHCAVIRQRPARLPDLQKLDLARPHTFRAVGSASKGKAHSAAIVGYAYLPQKACTAPADH